MIVVAILIMVGVAALTATLPCKAFSLAASKDVPARCLKEYVK